MKRLLMLLSVLFFIVLGPARPVVHSFLHVLDQGVAHAQDDDDQGEDDDDQGEDDDEQ